MDQATRGKLDQLAQMRKDARELQQSLKQSAVVNPQEIGLRLRSLRKDNNMSEDDVSALLGINKPQYYNIETGRSLITIQGLSTLSSLYGVSTDEILGLKT